MMEVDLFFYCINWICVAIFAICIKYVDDVRDEYYFGGKYVFVAFLIGNAAAAYAILFSPFVQMLLLAIVVGCFLGGKLDVLEFRITGVFIFLLALGIEIWLNRMPKFELCLWIMLAFLDEILNKQSDKMNAGFLKTLFKNKPLMPLAALIMLLVNLAMWERMIIIIVFDFSYNLVPLCQKVIQRIDPVHNRHTITKHHKRALSYE